MATNQYFYPNSDYPVDYTPSISGFTYNPYIGKLLVLQGRTVVSSGTDLQVLQLKNGLRVELSGTGFTYDAQGNGTAGTLTEVRILLNDGSKLVQTLTGISVDFTAFYAAGGGAVLAQLLLSGNDTLTGSSGGDEMMGALGNDTLSGLGGNDFFDGGAGADTYSGGDGIDTISFESAYDDPAATGGVVVDGVTHTAIDPYGNNETFTTVEAFRGTQFVDVMTGASAGGNVANESFMGLGGADTIDGGAGFDEARYDRDSVRGGLLGIDVNLVTGVATDGFGQVDTLTNIENVRGTRYSDTIVGNTAANELRSYGGADILRGGAGSDWLDGGIDGDTMSGGADNDTYTVDSANDTVDEVSDSGDGIDTVRSSITFSLAQSARVLGDFENLTLLGIANINATGNGLDNVLAGNAGNNYISGGGGADTMIGRGGNDFYVVDNAGDAVSETGGFGIDTVRSSITFSIAQSTQVVGVFEHLTLLGTANINATGNSLANTLTGNTGNNFIYGGGGSDRMIGLGGNDFYVVDSAGDIVTEAIGGGTDTVRSYITYTLGAYVENLTIWGSAATNGTGNGLNNTLTGNGATNFLSGLGGADKMIGLGGNDYYTVDNLGDVVTEASGGGIDTVRSYVSHILGANVENLTFWGSSAANGTGNNLNNTIIGNSATNVLYGGTGRDTLTGGAGKDYFVFNTAPNASTNVDRITDFSVPNDTIRFENAIFTALGSATGTLNSAMFWQSTSGTAHDANDRIIYETDTGKLFYDSNGSAAGGSVHVATLSAGLALTYADFGVI